MSRLHWFWRGAVATLASVVLGGSLYALIVVLINSRGMPNSGPGFIAFWIVGLLSVFIFPPVVAIAIYAALTRGYGPSAPDDEPQCRKCGYNLTGNVSGVCPECGERI